MQVGGVEERCKLPQRDLGQSCSRNRIWCFFVLFLYDFYRESTGQISRCLKCKRQNKNRVTFGLALSLPVYCRSDAENRKTGDHIHGWVPSAFNS